MGLWEQKHPPPHSQVLGGHYGGAALGASPPQPHTSWGLQVPHAQPHITRVQVPPRGLPLLCRVVPPPPPPAWLWCIQAGLAGTKPPAGGD